MSRTRVEILAQNVDIESTLALKDGSTTRLYIDSSGNLAIGNNTSPAGALDVTGNIVVSGTVDGRDLAADGAKLDAIEAGATADQTAAEIKTAYESNNNTNAFTDAEQTKLSGIATGAEVNVNADWNATTGDAVILNKPSIPTDNAQLTNGAGYITAFDITTQTDPKYLRSDASDSYTGSQLLFTDTGVSTVHLGGQGWQVSSTDNAYQRVDARDDGTNYARMHWYGVTDAGNTSNFRHAWYDGAAYFQITASSSAINFERSGGQLQMNGNTFFHAGNDGSGTGLDADTLDGIQSTGFLFRTLEDSGRNFILKTDTTTNAAGIELRRSDNTFQGQIYANGSEIGFLETSWGNWDLQKTHNGSLVLRQGGNNYTVAPINTGSYSGEYNIPIHVGGFLYPNPSGGAVTILGNGGVNALKVSGNVAWNAGNDGSGSSLDADMLDGYHLSGADSVSTKIFNNKGLTHNSLTNFDSNLNPGPNYINGGTNGPTGSGQWYGFMLGLGSEYNTTPGNNNGYASQFYWGRQSQTNNNPYLYVRDMETGSWGSWRKMAAGAADTAMTLDAGANYQTSQSTNAINRAYGMEIDFVSSGQGWPDYGTVVTAKSYSQGGGSFQLYNGYGSGYGGNNLRYRTADYSANTSNPPWTSWRQIWDAGNDGSGSGLDADTVDGIGAGSFIRNDTTDAVSTYSHKTQWYSYTDIANSGSSLASLECYSPGSGNDAFMAFHVGGDYAVYFGLDGGMNDIAVGGWSMGASRYRVWHAGNDSSGSGLDADLLDGWNSTNFIGKNGNSYYRPDTWIDFRTQVGLYWGGGSGQGWHLYPASTSSMLVRSGDSGSVNLQMQTAGTTRGYLYADSSNQIGFLNTSGSWSLKCDNSGNVTATGNVTAYSDIRLKSDIKPITNALDKVSQINGVTFTRVDSGERQAGVIAQDVEKVLPEVVRDGEDYKSVAYGNMVGLLVEAIKEQQATIQKLTERIEVLEGGN